MMKIMKHSCMCLGLLMLWTTGAVADDGTMFRKNVSNTPDLETEFATIRMLPLYVPAQKSDGTVADLEYTNADGTRLDELSDRTLVRPLINHYTDGAVTFIEEEGYGGFPGHGKRDAYGAVSLDDGATWKRTNLSKSGDLSSIKIKVGRKLVPYYGDVGRTFTASDGNQVLVTWVSKYCGSGSPAYSMTATEQSLLATHLAASGTVADAGACSDGDPLTPCPYLEDSFGVAGSQGVQKAADLAEDGYPLVGDYPFSCVWAARGVMLPPAEEGGVSTFTWFKAERLSSGVRSANRPEAVCVKGAGCVVTWQEDPKGIRPGEGEGPGEGWSGAVAHHQTDTWYSYIDWDDFGLVSGDETYGSFYNTTGSLAEWIAVNTTGSPKAAVPMAIPMRLTDNAMCTTTDSKPYCSVDYNGNGTADFCASSIPVEIVTPEGPTQTIQMCVTEDGRLMRGTTASTRARLGLHGYSTNTGCAFDKANPDTCPIDSAWFYVTYEENKGLGDICDDGYCEDGELTDADKRDMGKNVWYHTFDMFRPELVSQGLMLNQPAVYPDGWADPTGLLVAAPLSGFNFYAFTADPIYESQAGILTSTLYQTEIARRPSVISQDWYDAGPSGLVGFQLWKQGIIRRGGPADIMARRFVMSTAAEQSCTTEYKACTTEPVCTTENVCTIEQVCTDNVPNPAYDYKASICKKNPLLSRCLPYLDGSGTPTLEPQTCEEGVEICKDVTTCNDETSCETVASCDDYENCEAVETCTGGLDDNDNPYGYDKMECVNPDGSSGWAFTDGSNPRYVKGLCTASAINLSGNTVLTSETCGEAANCLTVFPFNDYFDDLDMTDAVPISKILTWQQYGVNNGAVLTNSWSLHDGVNSLDDQSWENPYDMAKGHRGFLAGDMVMAMYGWTNNWKALTEAKDIVNLYVRRSFDGGRTWTTLPASFTHTNGITYQGDGTTTCEFMGPTGAETEIPVCATYAAGEFEQARNVSQLLGSKVTVLDPRYTPTTRTINEAWVGTSSLPEGFAAPNFLDDTRDPSRFFMVYETGYSSAYDSGEAPPLDLFYSRAVDWGDDYMVWGDTIDECTIAEETPGYCNEFDAIEGSQLFESGEASVTCSPGGQFFYAVWNQWDFDKDGNEVGADDWFRRILFLEPVIDDGGGTE